ncbi:hypothetical protein OO012_17340 [Rhodobacteraceae bacterium KMM 6894]|nr:hypothetical protein [Rhodobacteraceae bacterium KMM 6894]
MTITTQNGFTDRLKKVNRKHARMARGYDSKVGRDGLIVFRPKRRKAAMPVRGLILAAVALFGFKALVIVQLGASTYDARVEGLQAGTTLEQIGAFVMQADPVSAALAVQMAPLF